MQEELGSAALHQAMEGKRGSIDENRLRTIIRETSELPPPKGRGLLAKNILKRPRRINSSGSLCLCNRYLTYDINFIGEKFLTSSNGSIG